jgi:hypothetical protein
MITPSDNDYKITKLVKQGKASLNPEFKSLADWVYNEYNTTVLNIYYDEIIVANNPRPRLNIIFEDRDDELKFRDGFLGNFLSDKQEAIAAKFAKLVIASPKYTTKNLLIIFSSFKPIAKDEANEAIPQSELDNLKTTFNNPAIWEISRFGSRVTIFFLTQDQADAARTSGYIDVLANKYFNQLKRYDEFDYFDKQTFSISVDSKESFEKNYQSNWYYYYM